MMASLVNESFSKSFAAFSNPVKKSVAFGPKSLDVLRVVVADELPNLKLFVREARKLGIHLFIMLYKRHVADRVRRGLKRRVKSALHRWFVVVPLCGM